jgi:integrase
VFIAIGRYTGARIGEIAALTTDDVLDVHGVRCLKIKSEKTACRGEGAKEEHRFVPIAPNLSPIFDTYLKGCSAGPLFPRAGKNGCQVPYHLSNTLSKVIKEVAPTKSFHCFRHYAISEMLNAGVSREIRMQVVGHKDDSVHGGYTHATVQSMLEAVGKIY